MEEIFKDIIGYEGLYQISNLGRVLNIRNKPREVKASLNGRGYYQVILSKKGIGKNARIHRLIAEYFLPIIENKNQVNHIDGDKRNNKLSNLEWVTIQENSVHYYKNWGNLPKIRKKVAQLDPVTNEVIAVYNSPSVPIYFGDRCFIPLSEIDESELMNERQNKYEPA